MIESCRFSKGTSFYAWKRMGLFLHSLLSVTLFFFLLTPADLLAQSSQQSKQDLIRVQPGYDKYAGSLKQGPYEKEKDSVMEQLGNLPAVPLAVTKAGIEKALTYIEKTHLDDKVLFVWDKIHEWGFHPTGQQLHDRPLFGWHVLWDRHELIQASPYAEYIGFTGWTGWNQWGYYEDAVRFNVDNIFHSKIYATQLLKYETRTRENFFGIGHNTSRGTSFTYRLEAMNYETRLGRWFDLPKFGHVNLGRLNVEAEYRFRDTRVAGGRNGANANIRNFFKDNAALAGVLGGEYNTFGINLMHDTRDSVDDPHTGGFRKFTVLYHEGVRAAQFDFMKYRYEFAQFFPVFKTGNVLGVRLVGENNQQAGRNGKVPFFEMARLGGFQTLRGFEYNRFFDKNALWLTLEYRYNVWTFKQYKLDLVPTCDMGSVYGEGGDFEFSNTRFSYGGAARFKIRDRVNIDFELAHSNEGTEYYIKYKAPF
ncbi:MAG: BamA/TamA family outer membrane protein [Candidatus Omnitrophica bacterium]|nr:BamA/TamA family outer membrane protein [Candidatus Omnitrophota bacterium]